MQKYEYEISIVTLGGTTVVTRGSVKALKPAAAALRAVNNVERVIGKPIRNASNLVITLHPTGEEV